MPKKRWRWLGLAIVLGCVGVALLVHYGLTYEPPFYRHRGAVPPRVRRQEADRFVSHSLQLRNDIENEDQWQAVFSDEEVNAWITEELFRHFADQVPSNIHDPYVVFELDQVTLAFKVDQGPFRSLVWVVIRPRVVSANTLALTLTKIRAGAMPVPADKVIDQLTLNARAYGLDIEWEEEDGLPVALVRYSPSPGRMDVLLDRVQLLEGQIFLRGRSNRQGGAVTQISLPSRAMLQERFPTRRKTQPPAPRSRRSGDDARSTSSPFT